MKETLLFIAGLLLAAAVGAVVAILFNRWGSDGGPSLKPEEPIFIPPTRGKVPATRTEPFLNS